MHQIVFGTRNRALSGFFFSLLFVLPGMLKASTGQWFELSPSFFFIEPAEAYLPLKPVLPQLGAPQAPYPNFSSVRHLDWGTSVRRVTDNQNGNPSALHRYSRRQAWNADETLLDLGDQIVDAESLSVITQNIDISSARNWSYTKPSIMYGIRYVNGVANSLTQYDVVQQQHTELGRFDGFFACSFGQGEGSLSIDERFVAVSCSKFGSNSIFLLSYDLIAKQLLGIYEIVEDFNWVSFSQSGRFIVVELKNVGAQGQDELLRFSPTFSDRAVIATQTNHGDLGKDVNGNDVFVMIDWDYISFIRLEDGIRVNLNVSSPVGPIAGHGHVSCRNVRRPGWCYISSYAQGAVGAVRIARKEELSPSYDNEGISAYEGVAEFEHWGFHRSTFGSYKSQPKVSVSPTGSQLIFSSDWHGLAAADDYVMKVINALPRPPSAD